jgi:hypothetical protein
MATPVGGTEASRTPPAYSFCIPGGKRVSSFACSRKTGIASAEQAPCLLRSFPPAAPPDEGLVPIVSMQTTDAR